MTTDTDIIDKLEAYGMGKDVLDFGQGLEAQMGGGGNILDDAMDLSFGRER